MTLRSSFLAARNQRWLRGCAALGEAPQLAGKPTLYVYGGEVRIGNRLHLASRPVPSHLVAGPSAVLEIGNDVFIGCGAAIAAYLRVTIGDGTCLSPYVIIMDTNFHGGSGDQSVQHDCRPVSIGKGCRIGSRVTITRGAIIGDGAEILAGSVVSSTIPPGACAAGARARIIGRAGDPASRWDSAAAALPQLLMDSLDLASPPDLDDRPIPAAVWSGAALRRLIESIESRFGTRLNDAACAELKTFADFADFVQHALTTHQRPSGGV